MQIKRIHIQNYKSLIDFELESPKQFCAFVGPNASGKSNIFEALEFVPYVIKYSFDAPSFFGSRELLLSFNNKPIPSFVGNRDLMFKIEFADNLKINFDAVFNNDSHPRFDSIAWGDQFLPDINEHAGAASKRKKLAGRRQCL